MWTQLYVNQDALSRIEKHPLEFVDELINALASREARAAVCVACFKPAAIVYQRDLDRPPTY
jgi:hypothetical protein